VSRFVAGDPLRGVAALAVFAFHAAAAAVILTGYRDLLVAPVGSPAGYLDAYGVVLGSLIVTGPAGPLVFFLLSGYLIGRPFVRALSHDRPLPSLTAYARNRALRVLPTFWFTLTAVVVIFVLLAGDAEVSLSELAELYALQVPVDNSLATWIAQAWTLTVEAKFYVVLPIAAIVAAPLLRRLPGPRARSLAIALACLAWFVAASFVYDGMTPGAGSFLYFLRMLTAGVAVAALEPLLRPRLAGSARLARIATASFALAVAYVLSAGALYELGGPFAGAVGRLLLDTAILGLLVTPLLRQWSDGRCWPALDNAATRWVGTRSYPFYMVHLAVLAVLGRELGDAGYGYKEALALLGTVGLVVSLALAELLHRGVERPFMERKRGSTRATLDAPPRSGVASG
jgi:peptidoglycan/LPS O-acetylase OafA/YrhL